jgi:hypothetical protein
MATDYTSLMIGYAAVDAANPTTPILYAPSTGKRRRWNKWLARAAFLTGVAVIGFYHDTIWQRLTVQFHQWQCMRYTEDPTSPPWIGPERAKLEANHPGSQYTVWPLDNGTLLGAALRPRCLRALDPLFPKFFSDGDSIVFLHERISPSGNRRLVIARFGPNMDHAQFCSIWAWAAKPATWTSAISVRAQPSVEWVPGFWYEGILREKLHFAEADPVDRSHFVFTYEHGQMPVNAPKDSSFYKFEHANDNRMFKIDGFLHDDDSIEFKVRD